MSWARGLENVRGLEVISAKLKPVIVWYMDKKVALYFRDQFRDARAVALRDSEAFEGIIFALEGLGKWLAHQEEPNKAHNINGLGKALENHFANLAKESVFAEEIPTDSLCRSFHTSFEVLFWLVVNARNSAFHEGAIARHLTRQSVELSLIVEDALMKKTDAMLVRDFMVRGPICAEIWQPLSFVRQSMLVNSFSYLPIYFDKKWHLISDLSIAQYITPETDSKGKSFDKREELRNEQKKRLVQSVEKAMEHGLRYKEAETCRPDDEVGTLIKNWEGQPILVTFEKNELLGIVTPYDLL